jgi:hypothetical protein
MTFQSTKHQAEMDITSTDRRPMRWAERGVRDTALHRLMLAAALSDSISAIKAHTASTEMCEQMNRFYVFIFGAEVEIGKQFANGSGQ